MNYHIITRYCKIQKKLKNSCQNTGNRDSEVHKSKIFPGEHAPGTPEIVRSFPTQYFPKFSTLRNATFLIARIVENNEDKNIIG